MALLKLDTGAWARATWEECGSDLGLVSFARRFCFLEVALWCGWTHWLRTVVLPGKRYVCINLDETMVRHEYASPKGNSAAAPRLSHREVTGIFSACAATKRRLAQH